MIDYTNAKFLKLKMVDDDKYIKAVNAILIGGEEVVASFKSVRDGVVFTNYRVIAINVEGLTGKKKDITSMPYRRVQSFSVETSGVMDIDSELNLWFSGLGNVVFEFTGSTDVTSLCKIISTFILK